MVHTPGLYDWERSLIYMESTCMHLSPHPGPSYQWKQYVNNTITTHWFYKFLSSASDKSSLRWISHASLKLGQCHPIWDTCPKSVHQIQAATIRARLLTGRYILQSLRARFNQNEVDPTCRACRSSTRNHSSYDCVMSSSGQHKTTLFQSHQ